MDHNYRASLGGEHEGFQDMYTSGRRPTGVYIPRFRNVGNDVRKYFIRGFAYAAGGSRRTGQDGAGLFGAELKEALSKPGVWDLWMTGMGECLPYYENFKALSKQKKDEWGMPEIIIDCEYKENELTIKLFQTIALTVSAVGAFTIAVFSIANWWQQRRHNRFSLRPIVTFWNRFSVDIPEAGVWIHNFGEGPAFITKVEYFLDEKPLEGGAAAFDDLIWAEGVLPEAVIRSTIWPGKCIPARADDKFLTLKNPAEGADRIRMINFVKRIAMRIEYTSIYQENFVKTWVGSAAYRGQVDSIPEEGPLKG
jgi:hypothetical protein